MRLVALQNNTRPSVPELGRIRLGDIKTDPKRPGKPLPYFRVDFHPQYQHLLPIWNEFYSTPPSVLDNVFAAQPLAGQAFKSSFEDWGEARTLKRRCDGATICQHYNPTTQRYDFTPKPCQCANLPKPVCRRVGRFSFILKDFFEFANSKGVHALGYFVVATSSAHNIQRIDALLYGIEAQYGSLQGIPFRLERTAEEVSTPIPENKDRGTPATRIMKTHYFVSIRTADAFAPHAAAALLTVGPQAPALPAPVSAPALPESIETDEAIIDGDHFEVPERRDVDLETVSVLKDKNGGRYLRFTTCQGFDVYRRSRDLFIAAGWIQDGDWQGYGAHELPRHIPAIVELQKDYWQVVHVYPAE